MQTLPSELLPLIVEFAPLFSKPVWEHAKVFAGRSHPGAWPTNCDRLSACHGAEPGKMLRQLPSGLEPGDVVGQYAYLDSRRVRVPRVLGSDDASENSGHAVRVARLVAPDPEGLDASHPAATLTPARRSPPPQLGRAPLRKWRGMRAPI